MDLLILYISVWFFLSGVAYFIEDYDFIRLLKKSGIPVSPFWRGAFWYTDVLYKRWLKKGNEKLQKI